MNYRFKLENRLPALVRCSTCSRHAKNRRVRSDLPVSPGVGGKIRGARGGPKRNSWKANAAAANEKAAGKNRDLNNPYRGSGQKSQSVGHGDGA